MHYEVKNEYDDLIKFIQSITNRQIKQIIYMDY